jgi:serine protease AprX
MPKLDVLLQARASLLTGQSRVIVRAIDGSSSGVLVALIQQAGGTLRRSLPIINGYAATVPNTSLPALAGNSLIQQLSLDRVSLGAMERTSATVGATAIRQQFGYDGSGIGVAVIDSGTTSWHDDLATPGGGTQRVDQFVDFVNGYQAPYDDYGHGTHVAGIIAGNGFDSGGARSGIAPGAHLVVLKVLDGSGSGRISDVIAALDYVVNHKDALNIRVVNMSVATGVYESYSTDPLTLAAQRAVAAGIVVVAAAGNYGRDQNGATHYGGITAPGNAPWVLTVGASSHMGTIDRADDTIAAFSSRGPTAVDYIAKPDLVAPGVGTESLSDPNSAFYVNKSAYLLSGTVPTSYLPYLSLSGTSMSAPVVTGTVALMLQANPTLTPNQIKAILQYTAQVYPGYDRLTEGAGFLNSKGAVELARFFAAPSTSAYPASADWSGQLIWGTRLYSGGRLATDANAWSTTVAWGAWNTASGQTVEWGVICPTANCDTGGGTWSRWGTTASAENVVWGTRCGGADCDPSSPPTMTSIAPSSAGDGVVWGTGVGDGVVWGTSGADGDGVVWGTSCTDPSCQPVIWGRR